VDEHGTRDGTPDELRFHLSGKPELESVLADSTVIDSATIVTLVLVPRCPAEFAFFCPNADSLSFGPDTLAVFGTHIPGSNPIFVLDRGSNRFRLPLRAVGYDHPRDRDSTNATAPVYSPQNNGRLRSWQYTFNCASGCEDLTLPREDQWEDDVVSDSDPQPGRSVFDRALEFTLLLDTLCTTPAGTPCPGSFLAALPAANLGEYAFVIEGRDTAALGSVCAEPSDLGPMPSRFNRDISELGLRTGLEVRRIRLRQLQDVRPYVPKPTHPTTASGTKQATRKRWWR
jgi:hypothetical protein